MGGGGPLTDSPTFKISMREYEDMAIKVGDKITIEINESDSEQREIDIRETRILSRHVLIKKQ